MSEQVEPSCFVSKLKYFLDLTVDEREALADMERNQRTLAAGETVYREGDQSTELFVVKSGWLYSYRHTEGGQRQIVQLRHPGDLCGMHDLMLSSRSDTMVALESSAVCPFPQANLRELMRVAPRVSLLINGIASLDHVLLSDMLQAIARTSASDRVLHLMLHLLHRLRINNPTMEHTFRLPVTQSLIGDLLGLTNVTVSKSMAELERKGLMSRDRERVSLSRLDEAVERLGFCDRYSQLKLDWLR